LSAKKSGGCHITTIITGALVVSVAVLVALAGLILVHRLVPATHRESYNAVAAPIIVPLSTLLGVLIAFAVFIVWQQFNTAQVTSEEEASKLAAIYWHAEELPESERQQIQELARSYAQVVIEEEWPLMEQGQASSQAWAIVDELRRSVDRFEPSTSTEETLHDRQVTLVDDMMNDRRLRLLQSREGMPTILWITLLSGSVPLIGFTYLLGLKHLRAHLLPLAMVTSIIVIGLFTIKSLEYPFSGSAQVKPSAFELVQNRFEADSQLSPDFQ
jgi:hypothetical protein